MNVSGCQQEGRRLVDNLLQGRIRRIHLQILRPWEEDPGGLNRLSADRDDGLELVHKHRLGNWSGPEMSNGGSLPHLEGSALGRRCLCPGCGQVSGVLPQWTRVYLHFQEGTNSHDHLRCEMQCPCFVFRSGGYRPDTECWGSGSWLTNRRYWMAPIFTCREIHFYLV